MKCLLWIMFNLCVVLTFQEAGGPKIPMVYGRVDIAAPEQCPPEGRLPG
jgi:L-ascorbate peroxidase